MSGLIKERQPQTAFLMFTLDFLNLVMIMNIE